MAAFPMLRLGGAAMYTLTPFDGLEPLIVSDGFEISTDPIEPFDDLVCQFLHELSLNILGQERSRAYSDIVSFAYWCRRSNIEKLKLENYRNYLRLGVGVAFHVTPSNVPVNFAFSYIFSLLSGNANIVRVPTKKFIQVDIICQSIHAVLSDTRFSKIKQMTAFFRYEKNDLITGYFSSIADARIIWGGDQAIANIRMMPQPERAIDVVFADRYSFCLINAKSVADITQSALLVLCGRLYNDVYLMDQNACSSPHLFIWIGSDTEVDRAKERLWPLVSKMAKEKYELAPENSVNKFSLACIDATRLNEFSSFESEGNLIYRVGLDSLPESIGGLRGNCGYIYEYQSTDLHEIASKIDTKCQTLTYFGFEVEHLKSFVLNNRLHGIDRIVPIGSALDIGLIWDGYDLISTLSRVIDIS
jgi:Acyl-CoA reductase (LuxC)